MQSALKEMNFVSFKSRDGLFVLCAKNSTQTTTVKWSLKVQTITYNTPQEYIKKDGIHHLSNTIDIGPAPIYIINKSNES